MTQEKPDWFKINPSQFLQDGLVDAMSTEELGMTFRLLCRQWIDGWIPDDPDLLARLCRTNRSAIDVAWPILSKFFPIIGKGQRANRFMWAEREIVASAMRKRRDDGRESVNRRWDSIRKSNEINDVDRSPNSQPIAHLIQESEEDKEKEYRTPPPPNGEGGRGRRAPGKEKEPKPVKVPEWKKPFPEDVLDAVDEIMGFWARPASDLQPADRMTGKRNPVPETSRPKLAERLAGIKGEGGDLKVCVAIGRRFVEEYRKPGSRVWMKAAQFFFGSRDDAPWHALYRAHVTNEQTLEIESGCVNG